MWNCSRGEERLNFNSAKEYRSVRTCDLSLAVANEPFANLLSDNARETADPRPSHVNDEMYKSRTLVSV